MTSLGGRKFTVVVERFVFGPGGFIPCVPSYEGTKVRRYLLLCGIAVITPPSLPKCNSHLVSFVRLPRSKVYLFHTLFVRTFVNCTKVTLTWYRLSRSVCLIPSYITLTWLVSFTKVERSICPMHAYIVNIFEILAREP